jgi:hypothetical protein
MSASVDYLFCSTGSSKMQQARSGKVLKSARPKRSLPTYYAAVVHRLLPAGWPCRTR